jgi:hypothetical protein
VRGGRPKGAKSPVNGSQHTSEFAGAEFVGANGTKSPINGSQHIQGGGGGGKEGEGGGDADRMNFEGLILGQQVRGRGEGAGGGSWAPQNTVLLSGDVPGGRIPIDGSEQAGAHHPLSSWEQKVISETRRRERQDIRMQSPREAAAVAGLRGGGWEGGHGEYGRAEYGGADEAGGGNLELQNRIVKLTDKVSNTPLIRDNAPLMRDNAPLMRDNAPLMRDNTPLLRDNTPLMRDHAPLMRNYTALMRDCAPTR